MLAEAYWVYWLVLLLVEDYRLRRLDYSWELELDYSYSPNSLYKYLHSEYNLLYHNVQLHKYLDRLIQHSKPFVFLFGKIHSFHLHRHIKFSEPQSSSSLLYRLDCSWLLRHIGKYSHSNKYYFGCILFLVALDIYHTL